MNSKSLLIAIAALALTATGAQAFSSSALIAAGLSEEQQAAFEVARELREEGDVNGARDVLVEAGIDEDTLEKVRTAIQAERLAYRTEMKAALLANDFKAFTLAVKDSPLADVVTTEEDFQSFREAHALRASGDKQAAKAIFTDLGIKGGKDGDKHHKVRGHHGAHPTMDQLTGAQKAAFNVARQANDREAMEAILEEAGVVKPTRGDTPRFLKDGRELQN